MTWCGSLAMGHPPIIGLGGKQKPGKKTEKCCKRKTRFFAQIWHLDFLQTFDYLADNFQCQYSISVFKSAFKGICLAQDREGIWNVLTNAKEKGFEN